MAIQRARSLLGLAIVVIAFTRCAAGSAPATPSGPTSTPPASAPTATMATPIWQVGDRWVYEWTSGKESGTKTVEVVDLRDLNGVAYYVVRLAESEHYYTRTLHWAAAIREGKVEARMVPPHPWFAWPLAPGMRWTHQGQFETREGVAKYNDRFAVIGVESVEVPAGRYQAVRLVRETDRGDGDEYWYAPDVRWYARWLGRRGDTQFEERLREYQPTARPR